MGRGKVLDDALFMAAERAGKAMLALSAMHGQYRANPDAMLLPVLRAIAEIEAATADMAQARSKPAND